MITAPATLNEDIIESCSKELEKASRYLVKDLFEGPEVKTFKDLNKSAGVYAFWWRGDQEILKEAINEGKYFLKGPHNSDRNNEDLIPVEFNDAWIEKSSSNGNICLYVGKSTTMRERILGHLRYTVDNIWKDKENIYWPESKDKLHGKVCFGFGRKPNSVSQLRIGLERIFRKHSLELIKEHIAISWIELPDGEINNSVNRFFIEDKLISEYFPLFNVDVER